VRKENYASTTLNKTERTLLVIIESILSVASGHALARTAYLFTRAALSKGRRLKSKFRVHRGTSPYSAWTQPSTTGQNLFPDTPASSGCAPGYAV